MPLRAPFVDFAFLEAHRDEVTLADVRWYPDGRSAREAFEAGHLRGAVFVDLERDCSGRTGGGRHPLPTPEEFAAAMGEVGIGDGDSVVCYDDAGGVVAARLVWMLRAVGHDAALLDGGIGAAPGRLETGPGELRAVRSFSARPWPAELLADAGDVMATANLVIDARDRLRYEGQPHPLDPRPGHVPGARNLPARENTDGEGRLLPSAELRARFEKAGAVPGTTPILYCGSGVSACHDLLVLEHVGLPRGRLYPGSWSEYSRDGKRPAALGGDPG